MVCWCEEVSVGDLCVVVLGDLGVDLWVVKYLICVVMGWC